MNLGNLLTDLGEYEHALREIQSSLNVFEELGLRNYVALSLMNAGRLRAMRGELGEAVGALGESRRIYARMRLQRERAFTDLYLLHAYIDLNLHREARRACRAAIKTFALLAMPFEHAQSLLTFATLLRDSGKNRLAQRYAARASDLFRETGNELWHQIARSQAALLSTQPFDQILAEIRDARKKLQSLGAKEFTGQLLLSEGLLQIRLHDDRAARRSYEETLELASAIGSDELLYRAHWGIGSMPTTPSCEAIEHLELAADHVERLRLRTKSGTFKISFLTDKTPLYDCALRYLLEDGARDHDRIFNFAERARSRSIVDSIVDIGSSNRVSSPRERELHSQIAELRARATAAYDKAYGVAQEAADQSDLESRTRLRRIEQQIAETRQALFLLRPTVENSPLATLDDLRVSLDRRQAALLYFEADNFVHALIVSHTTTTVVERLWPVKNLQRETRRLRFHLGKAAYGSSYLRENIHSLRDGLNASLLALGERLFRPLVDDLGQFEELVIIPSSTTYGLPMHAFMVSKIEYAVDRFCVQYAPSATVRTVNASRPAREHGPIVLVAISDPSIAGVRDEVDRLAAILTDAVVLVDDEATVATFRERAVGASAVHLATHGVFREDNPAFSGIKFADGWMTAAELAEICRDASLVTLSACETGVGIDEGGGEIMGISQAILGAGSSSLASSLWTADDRTTIELMVDFYNQLGNGVSAPHAMRSAMLAARQRDDHPYFWAPFAVFGEGKLPTCR
jgi:CHAT domain-containing protein